MGNDKIIIAIKLLDEYLALLVLPPGEDGVNVCK
jgi:hypothetical protein